MPTTAVTVRDILRLGSTGGNAGLSVPFVAADVPNQNKFAWTGREILLARNTGASVHNVTIQSPNLGGRTVVLAAQPIAAAGDVGGADFKVWYGFDQTFMKTGTIVEFGADHAEVVFAVVRLPV